MSLTVDEHGVHIRWAAPAWVAHPFVGWVAWPSVGGPPAVCPSSHEPCACLKHTCLFLSYRAASHGCACLPPAVGCAEMWTACSAPSSAALWSPLPHQQRRKKSARSQASGGASRCLPRPPAPRPPPARRRQHRSCQPRRLPSPCHQQQPPMRAASCCRQTLRCGGWLRSCCTQLSAKTRWICAAP